MTLASGVSVHYRCVGHGAPAILLEAGTDSGGTDSVGPGFVDPLAEATPGVHVRSAGHRVERRSTRPEAHDR
jgi:hypothetical protein